MPSTATAIASDLIDREEVRHRLKIDDGVISDLIAAGTLPVASWQGHFRKMWFDPSEVERVRQLLPVSVRQHWKPPAGLITRKEAMRRLRCTDVTMKHYQETNILRIQATKGRQQYYDPDEVDRLALERAMTLQLTDDEAWQACEQHRHELIACWRATRLQKEVWNHARTGLHLNMSRRQMNTWLQHLPERDAIVSEIRNTSAGRWTQAKPYLSPYSTMGKPEPAALITDGPHWKVRSLSPENPDDAARIEELARVARRLFAPEAVEQRQRARKLESLSILAEVAV